MGECPLASPRCPHTTGTHRGLGRTAVRAAVASEERQFTLSQFLHISLTSGALAGPRYVPHLLNTHRKHLFQLSSTSSRDQGEPGTLLLECRCCGSPPSCTDLACTALACTALPCTALSCTALPCTALPCTVLDPEARCTALSGRARSTSNEHCWLRSASSSRRTCKCVCT